MALELLVWAWNRFRPREGWLPFLLVTLTVGCLVAAVIEVDWVPQANVVIVTAAAGLGLGTLLAKTSLPAWRAWIYLILYGLLVPVIVLANLLPPAAVLLSGWTATSAHWRQQGALFVERISGWLATVTAGQSSQETIVFALLLGLAAWFAAAYVAWSTFRQRQPIAGLALMAVALALNSYYGGAPRYWPAVFIGLVAITAAVCHYATMEQDWQHSGIDYSTEIRADLLLYAGAAGMVLLALSWAFPAINIERISQTFIRQPAVIEAEEALSRAFAAIPQPRRDETVAPGVRGVLPRSFLIGDAPELLDSVVMTATVQCSGGCQPALQGYHWRAGSYDIYTGRGWSLSPEREEQVAAGDLIEDQLLRAGEQGSGGAEETEQSRVALTQQVQWIFDQRHIRYTIGYPLRFDQPALISWRGPGDLSHARGLADSPTTYTAESWIPQATAAQLRQARLEDVPSALLARYTALPGTVPERVHELAQELATGLTPYEQARAIEEFLRQYTYTLEVELPPAGADVVDYFLFDAQEGYCDYYASAMVVLARSVGLPARLATGFLPQPPDAGGAQTIRQINGHSWAEIYFASFGWIEFEPTAAFISPHGPRNGPTDNANTGQSPPQNGPPETSGSPLPIPDRVPQRPIPWPLLILLFLLLVLLSWRWGWPWWQAWRRRPRNLDAVEQAYLRLQQSASGLGWPPNPNQTPGEFTGVLLTHLKTTTAEAVNLDQLQSSLNRLTNLFVAHQYAGRQAQDDAEAADLWRQMRRPLWGARLRRPFVARFARNSRRHGL